jgi:dTDP-4-amino-4,6-dideoxygalactose transaminase
MTLGKLAIHGGKPTASENIPIAKPVFSQKAMEDVVEVLKSRYVVQGPKVKEFEDKFREKTGAKYAYAVNSGTAALHIAFLSFLKPGDEVIVPSFTFIATASTVFFSQGKPVFADIDEETFIIDPEDVKEKITPKTKAIVPVHLYGSAANMDALYDLAADHDLVIVNDSAQAHGTELNGRDIGSLDHINCYSFYPSKSMTTAEGGMVTTSSEEHDRLGRLIRAHGDDARYHHVVLGLNYRLTEIAAVIGLNQLSKLDDFIAKRRHRGAQLREQISKIDGLNPQRIEKNVNSSYSYFTLTMDMSRYNCTRDEFIEALRSENISAAVHYPVPLTKQPAITDLMKPEKCPVSEDVSERIFSLPMFPDLTDENIRDIVTGVEKVASHYLI